MYYGIPMMDKFICEKYETKYNVKFCCDYSRNHPEDIYVWTIDPSTNRLYSESRFIALMTDILAINGYRYIAVNIRLERGKYGHRNIIIIDRETKTMQYFEPNEIDNATIQTLENKTYYENISINANILRHYFFQLLQNNRFW